MEKRPVVTPGELLTGEAKNWLHGKGTYVNEDVGLVSSLCGEIQMMDRMVRVEAASSRYVGNTGDCVVGRVTAVGAGRWRVDLGSHLDSVLLLQNVNLPGGTLRRKTAEDARHMREHFKENDMLSAEVQKVNRDGSLSLHTRSTRYGKLAPGVLVSVPAVLIKRLKTHFHVFEFGIEALIGVNGSIWLSMAKRRKRKRAGSDSDSDAEKIDPFSRKEQLADDEPAGGEAPPMTPADRLNIARVRAAILILADEFLEVSPLTILDVYDASITHQIRPPDMLKPDHRADLSTAASERVRGTAKKPKKGAEN